MTHVAGARPVRAVLFDWGGTLTPSHDVDLRGQWTAFADGYGTMACARDRLAGKLLVAEEELWAATRQAPEHRNGTLTGLLESLGLGLDEPATQAGIAAYRQFWEPHSFTHPGAGYLLEALRAEGLRIGLLSNTIWDRAHHEDLLVRDGVLDLFDAVVLSSELGVAKPAPAAFRAAARAVGVEPAECVYVGDRVYQDVFGAQRAGMRAVLVGPGTASLGPHEEIGEVEPDAQVGDVTDVYDVVRAWHGAPLPG